MPKSSTIQSPIFIPRLVQQDSNFIKLRTGKYPMVLINANIVSLYPKFLAQAIKASKVLIIDPVTNRLIHGLFEKKKGFQKLPYAPKRAFSTNDLLSKEPDRIAKLVEPCIKFQLEKGAGILIAPYFFTATNDNEFRLNLTLLSDSIKFIRDQKVNKPLFAMINIGNVALSKPKTINQIVDRYEDFEDLQGCCIMVDSLDDRKTDEDLLSGLAYLAFQLSESKDVFVLSIGAFGEVLSAIGIDGFSSGIAWLETFTEKTLRKKLMFSPRKKKAGQTYVPELFNYINDELVKLIGYKCQCRSCDGGRPTDLRSKKLHFIYRRLEVMRKLSRLSRKERINFMKDRLKKALELAGGLADKFAVPLNTRHISNWLRILEKAEYWKHEKRRDQSEIDLDQLIRDARA